MNSEIIILIYLKIYLSKEKFGHKFIIGKCSNYNN